ncbi:MAG: sensor histidine kinase [bacterium]|nr:sensor histidine kinase [bacterium]
MSEVINSRWTMPAKIMTGHNPRFRLGDKRTFPYLSARQYSLYSEQSVWISAEMKTSDQYIDKNSFLLSVIGSAPYGIITIDQRGCLTIVNDLALEQLELNIPKENLSGTLVFDLIEDISELKSHIKKCITSNTYDFDIEEVALGDKYLTFRGRKIEDGMIITIADITSLKDTEYQSLNSMLEGQEMERKRIAREIHDGIGPLLSTVKMNLANIEGEIDHLPKDMAIKFRQSYQLIDEAAGDLRAISHNLMPKVLSDFGLIEALETLCEKIDLHKKVNVEFICTGFDERLDEVSELGMYRICQELLNNSLKHANASYIAIQLFKSANSVRLSYEDDGVGFDTNQYVDGIGLMNIESRVKALAGEFLIDSSEGKGMTATIEVPLIIELE